MSSDGDLKASYRESVRHLAGIMLGVTNLIQEQGADEREDYLRAEQDKVFRTNPPTLKLVLSRLNKAASFDPTLNTCLRKCSNGLAAIRTLRKQIEHGEMVWTPPVATRDSSTKEPGQDAFEELEYLTLKRTDPLRSSTMQIALSSFLPAVHELAEYVNSHKQQLAFSDIDSKLADKITASLQRMHDETFSLYVGRLAAASSVGPPLHERLAELLRQLGEETPPPTACTSPTHDDLLGDEPPAIINLEQWRKEREGKLR